MMDIDLDTFYDNLDVAVWQGLSEYTQTPPFHPHTNYPEYKVGITGSEFNPAYEGVRSCFKELGLDAANFGSSQWNPLSEIIQPGNCVVLKPNFVLSHHSKGGDLYAIITHPSIIRAVVDYVYLALNGKGKIVIADAPQMDCNFQELLQNTSLTSIQELYLNRHQFCIDIVDLRNFWLDADPEETISSWEKRYALAGDPLGNVLINVGKNSAFYSRDHLKQMYGADYNRQETISHHHDDIHEYSISRTILDADVLVSIPKMKVHKKVGVTLNTKGLVGINTNKNLLIHYTLGTPEQGGDQFPPQILSKKEKILVSIQRYLYDSLLSHKKPFLEKIYNLIVRIYRASIKPLIGTVPQEKRILDGGNWYGNDSAWRMSVDLMRIALFADKEGILKETPQRKFFSIIDGVIGGENNGPLIPDSKRTGVILAGFNPLAVDIVGTRLMGFDWTKLAWINYLLQDYFRFSPQKINILSTIPQFRTAMGTKDPLLNFLPHPGWKNWLEI